MVFIQTRVAQKTREGLLMALDGFWWVDGYLMAFGAHYLIDLCALRWGYVGPSNTSSQIPKGGNWIDAQRFSKVVPLGGIYPPVRAAALLRFLPPAP